MFNQAWGQACPGKNLFYMAEDFCHVERTRAFEVERDPFDDGVEAALERLSA